MNTSTPEAHETVAAELVRRGLPIDYAQRAAAELADHHRDLVAELRGAGLDEPNATAEATRRLGDARTLVKKTVREYQRRFWCGRWPLLTFLLGPIPLLVLAWVATGLLLFCILWPLKKLGIEGPEVPDGVVSMGEWVIDRMVAIWFLFAVPALVLLVFARLARRAALRWPWIALVACLLALSAGMIKSGFPDQAHKPRSLDGTELRADAHLLYFGLPWFAPATATPSMLLRHWWKWYTHDWEQTGQLLLPMIVAASLLLRARQLSLQAERLVLDGC